MTIKRRLTRLEEVNNPNKFVFSVFYKDEFGVIRDQEGRTCQTSGNAIILNERLRPEWKKTG